MNKRFSALVAVLFLGIFSLYAVPAQRAFKTYKQPDGSTITVALQGDEFGHWYVTPDNRIHKKLSNGQFVPCSYFEIADLKQRREEAQRQAWDGNDEAQHSSPRRAGRSRHPKGDQRVLVILAEYQDLSFTIDDPRGTFTKHLNEKGYKGSGGYGSARDYFVDQSDGQFTPQFDVYGPYKASHDMAYYGGNEGNGADKNAAELVSEVVEMADKDVNYKDYDTDGNGTVDFCYVIYAGYGESSGADENTIWPHATAGFWFKLGTGAETSLDGMYFNSYACSCELSGTSGTNIDGIGTICHEFSHTLGLPDFYDTDYNGHFGMSRWSLMDNGCYNEDGYTPCGYTAYEKEFLGWIEIETLDKEQSVSLTPTDKGGKAYRIENSENTNEYYIVENIQQEGWNRGAYGHGMLVTHVDYESSAWTSGTVNCNTPERMTIVPADNHLATTVKSLAGDPYPGSTGNTELTDTSTPAAETNNGSCFSQPITDITEADGIVTFNFMKGCGEATTAIAATDVTSCSFKAKWNKRIGTDDYTLEVFHITGEIPEDQSQWNNNLLNTRGELIATFHTRSTEYTVTNLEANSLYCYRARCLKNGTLSTVSNLIYVLTKEDKGTLAAPTLNKPVKGDSTITLSWNAVQNAKGYIIEYEYQEKKTIIPDGRKMMGESFLRVKESCGDITRVLDLYTDTTGWIGNEVHGQDNRILLGSEEDFGYIISPVIPQTEGMVTVKFTVSKYSSSDEKPIFIICIATDEDLTNYTEQIAAYITDTEDKSYYAVLGPLSTGSRVYFITENQNDDTPRICLDNIEIYWGDIYADDAPANHMPFSNDPQCLPRWSENSELLAPASTASRPTYVATSRKKHLETEDTQITINGLKKGDYTFRVRSWNDKTYSPYSEITATQLGNDSHEVDGMNFRILSEEKKLAQMIAFEDISRYEGNITVPETIQIDGDTYAVTSLADSLFRGCYKLTSVTVPATITYAGSELFKGCCELAYVDWKSACALDSVSFVGLTDNTLVFVNGDTEVATNLAYVVRDRQIDSLAVSVGSPFLTPYDIQVGHVEYSKDFSQKTILGTTAGWETLVLPFDVQTVSHEQHGKLTPFGTEGSDRHFWLGAYNGNAFEKAQQIKANVPYIISFPNSTDYAEDDRTEGLITFSADNTVVHATTNVPVVTGSEFDFAPVYKKVFKASNHYMLNTYDYSSADKPSGSTFMANTMSLRTFGAYMRTHGQANAPRYLPIRFNDEVEEPDTEATTNIYGVDGRLVRRASTMSEESLNELEPGIYVIEGKKFIVK